MYITGDQKGYKIGTIPTQRQSDKFIPTNISLHFLLIPIVPQILMTKKDLKQATELRFPQIHRANNKE